MATESSGAGTLARYYASKIGELREVRLKCLVWI
jgi:hypothetical protein